MKLLHLKESVGVDLGPNAEEIRYQALKLMESKGGIVVPTIEAIHASITRNFTFYGAPKLKGKADYVYKETGKLRPTGVHSWNTPFPKPMLVNHDIYVDPLGRIPKAEFKNKTSTGVPGIIIYPEIVDPDAAQKVLDGRYNTVSIGSDVADAACSICKKSVFEGCDHFRGRMYEGKLCFWVVGDHWYQECSFVNAPSDENAGVKDLPGLKESYIQMGLLVQDFREHKLYDLQKDEIYAATSKGLVLIPRTEYIQEYFYVPFNIKLEEMAQEETSNVVEVKAADNPNGPKGKNDKPIGKMKTGTTKQLLYGHSLVHGYFRKGNTNWTRDQIIAEHKRLVRIMKARGLKHTMRDSLDDTLPADLKSWYKGNK
jgi:hypothetical protein